MNIEQARKLKYGQTVHCPADRGEPAYTGTVRSEDCATCAAHLDNNAKQYIWIEVQGAGKKSVWPSNRLG